MFQSPYFDVFWRKMALFPNENVIKIRFSLVFPQKWIRMLEKSKKLKNFQICHKVEFCPERKFLDVKSQKT